jgi:hypothetical protein
VPGSWPQTRREHRDVLDLLKEKPTDATRSSQGLGPDLRGAGRSRPDGTRALAARIAVAIVLLGAVGALASLGRVYVDALHQAFDNTDAQFDFRGPYFGGA